MRLLLILFSLLAAPCHGANVFECRAPDGRVSFQDHGCAPTATQREIALAAPRQVRDAAAREHDAGQIATWEKSSRSRLPASLGGSARGGSTATKRRSASRQTRPDSCAIARSEQARQTRERSFEMGFDERRRLSDTVLLACGLR